MLNKELLLATGGQPVEPIKLKVGAGGIGAYGYYAGQEVYGSVSKVPCWNANGKPDAMSALGGSKSVTWLWLTESAQADGITKISVTVVEKKLTVTLVKDDLFGYSVNETVFTSPDEGKTFTIIFDPEPISYA